MGDDERSPRIPWWRRWFGMRSERVAARHLRSLGYQVVAVNHRNAGGELDIVAIDRDCVVFAEVRSTSQPTGERPASSVDVRKQKRLTEAALRFLQQHRLLGRSARFDVLTVSWPPGARSPSISHYQNAFEASGNFQMFR
jgi:putative endonuclease